MIDIEKEVWKEIDLFPGYEVSNLGRVKSRLFGKERILKAYRYRKISRSYLHVNLHGKTFNVHKLVANAFVPNPNGYNQVNHKDENDASHISRAARGGLTKRGYQFKTAGKYNGKPISWRFEKNDNL